ncbi:phage baseplate protein [Megasphaera sueciensis]|uniref:phage baseplate protein n=1 Tax=Megasphaera sueciensis TaxID=349094 RepID=UPI003D087512
MAYDSTKPTDDEYLSTFPAEMREQLRAIISDQIVNALKLQGLIPANTTGQIPVSNGNVNTNLNADMLDGKHSASFSDIAHIHSDATKNADGFMSSVDKTKLDGVEAGAEVNQNAISNIAVGSTTIQADNKQDTLTIVNGANITVTPDATNDKITIAVSGTVPMAVGCTGNAATATKLKTARKISLTGDATGSVSDDGSEDIDIEVAVGSANSISSDVLKTILLVVYPVGSYYWNDDNTDPSTLFGGTWIQIKDKFVLAAGDTYKAGDTAGEATHILTINEMPSHRHGASADSQGQHTHSITYTKNNSPAYHGAGSNVGHLGGNGQQWNWSDINTNAAGLHSHNITINSTGDGQAHNNMPPYIVAYCWKRTA